MTKLRLFTTLAFTGTLLLSAGAALAQEEAAESPAPESTPAVHDTSLAELKALVPPTLAGWPLDENLQLATGEQMLGVMRPEETAVLGDLLATVSATTADYAAAATWLPVSDVQTVVIQAHRIAGTPATEAIDAWVEILSLNVGEPLVEQGSIAGRSVTLMSDGTNPDAPTLHMFPAADVVWMVWTDDEALVATAMDAIDAQSQGGAPE